MEYVLMMRAPRGPYAIYTWPKRGFEAHIAFLNNLTKTSRSRESL
jgi:hypothetical protein